MVDELEEALKIKPLPQANPHPQHSFKPPLNQKFSRGVMNKKPTNTKPRGRG